MKFNYVLLFLALVFAVGSPATVTETRYSNNFCDGDDCKCEGRIHEIVWSDGNCRVSALHPTKQSFKFDKAADGKYYERKTYGWLEESIRLGEVRKFDTKCSADQESGTDGYRYYLNVCHYATGKSKKSINVWDDTSSFSYPTSGVWQVKNEYNNKVCSGNPYKFTAKNIACSPGGGNYGKTVVDSNGAWISQTHKNENCLDVPAATQAAQVSPAGKCVGNDDGTSIKYTLEGAAAAKLAADADTAAKAEKAYEASLAEDALGEGQKVDFQIIIALIFGIIVTIFNN